MKALEAKNFFFHLGRSGEEEGEGRESKYFFFFKTMIQFTMKDKDYLHLTIFEVRVSKS